MVKELLDVQQRLKNIALEAVKGGPELDERLKEIGLINKFWAKTQQELSNAAPGERVADLVEQIMATAQHIGAIAQGLRKVEVASEMETEKEMRNDNE